MSKSGKFPVRTHMIELAELQFGPEAEPLEQVKRALAKLKPKDFAHARAVHIFIIG